MKNTLKTLVETHGPSGFEDQVRTVIRKMIGGLADSVRVTPLGNLIAVKKGSGGRNAKRVMLSAHMDEIGLMVTHITKQGYARVTNIGGVSAKNTIGGRVLFADGTIGTVNAERLDPITKLPLVKHLYIDTGARDKASSKVKVGDAASFVRPFLDMGNRMLAKSMDDRVGCAILIETLRRLKRTPHEVHFVFSVQEEITLAGARTAAFEIEPDVAIAVDVTPSGDTPNALTMAIELGKGPAIKVRDTGMTAHVGVKELMVRRAKQAKIPCQLEILVGGTTDAAVIQVAREGVPSGCLSVPCRYVHTQSEMVDTKDVEQCVELFLAILRKPIDV